MSRKLFRDLGIPAPYQDLEVGSGSHAVQTAKIMMRLESLLLRERPDLILVVGDVNSTMAASLVAAKMEIPLAHVEAGLRSFDRSMPEEINRKVTDGLADYLFTTSPEAERNLKREGVESRKIFFVGNVMVDTLLSNLKKASRSRLRQKLGLVKPYAVLTLHRPSNVDRDKDFAEILTALAGIQKKIKIVFPVHPRTAARLRHGRYRSRLAAMKNLILIPPVGYLDFIHLMKDARLVLTDSGGVQEESTVLKVPCLTLRDNTERPVTLFEGSNILAGRKSERILKLAARVLKNRSGRRYARPAYWDGKAAERIVRVLSRKFGF